MVGHLAAAHVAMSLAITTVLADHGLLGQRPLGLMILRCVDDLCLYQVLYFYTYRQF